MANFPPSFLDEVLSRTDIVDIIARHVELKKAGSNMMGLCPFHHEKSPSFSVSADKQLYYCFGCGKGGGAFQFLMEHDGYSFPEAVEYLAEKAGLEVPKETQRQPGDEERQKKAYTLLSRASDAFARALYGSGGGNAVAYIKQRGLPESIVRGYGLGYAPDGYGFMQQVFGTDNRSAAQLEAVGLLFKGERGYGDRFRNRLMFTIRDRRGRVVGFGGRVLGEGEPKYLNSPETNWFHKSDLLYGFSEHRDTIRKEKQLVVVEGYMDVLALAAYGLKIGLAPLGTAIGERQIREIFRLCEGPVFCFDGDRAGRQAAWRALERMMPLLKAELEPKFLYLPEGEDPDSLLAKEGAESFRARMKDEAKPVLETWLMGLKLLAGQGVEGRARMAKKADSMLATMTDNYLAQAWRQEVEQATGISLKQHLRRSAASSPSPSSEGTVELSGIEERFLAGLFQRTERFRDLPEIARNFLVDNDGVRPLYLRAFSIIAATEDDNTDIARQLAQEFPESQTLISRWVNQAAVQDVDYKAILLVMESNYIKRRLSSERDTMPFEEKTTLPLRLREIDLERIKLGREQSDTGA
ncbi:DNA primase [Mariprofundus ferrinatatus]|uniref:DNA primase n=1 Tax=Mariprofundus ferrinatatus TaxID=1921087 RepID=A0A2K8L7Q6_9PROT|nr:DNA primase [Mariprofundus ferrinatatus]ATX80974.1 DNA primase [Mariprofundus ferrinatatus]